MKGNIVSSSECVQLGLEPSQTVNIFLMYLSTRACNFNVPLRVKVSQPRSIRVIASGLQPITRQLNTETLLLPTQLFELSVPERATSPMTSLLECHLLGYFLGCSTRSLAKFDTVDR